MRMHRWPPVCSAPQWRSITLPCGGPLIAESTPGERLPWFVWNFGSPDPSNFNGFGSTEKPGNNRNAGWNNRPSQSR